MADDAEYFAGFNLEVYIVQRLEKGAFGRRLAAQFCGGALQAMLEALQLPKAVFFGDDFDDGHSL